MPRKLTQEEFIDKSKKIFGDQLDYSKVNYINGHTKIILICKKHGEFLIAPAQHICYKRGCSICSGVKYNTEVFIDMAKEIHKDEYCYDKVKYINCKKPVIIICKIHGDFLQNPEKHILRKQGCPDCYKPLRNIEYVIEMGTKIHKGKYNYSLSKFTKMFNKIIIICPKHGEFKQTPANHINNNQGCPACMVNKSKKEELWLDSIGLPDDNLHRTMILRINDRKFIVDGYDPDTNTIYEFYGDFWHGNPKKYKQNKINIMMGVSFKKLYKKTLNREKFLIKNGYKIVSIWENDFDKIQKQKKKIIKCLQS